MFKVRRNSVYVKWGLTAFLTVLAILAVYDIFFGAHHLAGYLSTLNTIITPVVYGAAIAYLLSPIVDFLERTALRPWAAAGMTARKQRTWVRVVSVLLTLVLVLGAIALLLAFLLPDLADSIVQLAENIPVYVQVVQGWMQNAQGSVELPAEVETRLMEFYNQAMATISSADGSTVSSVIAAISGGVMGVAGFFGNLVVGLVVAAYMLGMKETLAAQAKKIVCAVFDKAWVERILAAARYSDEVFGGFIRGNIIDSIVVGIICFVAFRILGFPYAPLLSVLIAVTNLIPFFGPFMGAIPSCILIFLVSPIKCLEFIVFILVLQQLDGNIVAPKILGQSTGLASLWVIISVLVAGGLFGPIGMLLGCPAFALIYALIRLGVTRGLEQKELPVATDAYRFHGTPETETAPEDGEGKT